MGENGEAFREMQDIYNEAMEMIDHDLENMLGDDYCGGVSDDEVENAVAAENNRIVSTVMKTAVQAVGKCINDTVAAYDGGDEYKGEDSFKKGDRLRIIAGSKSFHAIYVSCGKVIYYSKGYDFFPEVKLVPLGFFAKKGKVEAVKVCGEDFSSEIAVRRAMSRLGDNDFKNSEEFVKWCFGEKEC